VGVVQNEPDVPVPDQRGELEQLHEEVARLQAQLAETTPGAGAGPGPDAQPSSRRQGWWRPWVAGVLIVLGAVLAPLSVVAIWAHDEMSDTDRYVDTVAPLASDPQVQAAVSARLTELIFAKIPVEEITGQAIDALESRGLPPRIGASLAALSTPLANGVHSFVAEKVDGLVRSQAFRDAWEQANRQAHGQMVAVLTGKTDGAVTVNGGQVTVNLATVIEAVKQRLVDAGFSLASRIPPVNAQFAIMDSADLQNAQTGFRLLSTAAHVLPFLALACVIGAVAVGRSRRRTVVVAFLAVAASMVVLGLALNVSRGIYLDSLPSRVHPGAAAVIFDTLIRFIRMNLRALLVLSLAIAAVAWVSGPGPAPVAVRRGTTRSINAVRSGTGLRTGHFGEVAHTYRTQLRVGVLGLALLVYVLASHPTGAWTLGLVVVTAVVLLVLELVSHPPETAAAVAPPETSAGSPA
jgi:hypothetical protein